MMELLLLLLPVAAASGWVAAKRGERRAGSRTLAQDPAYFKGLNYLLNEQPDKAIDVFIQMLEVDCDTVETHLALGNLFRRRGEVDRAIRIHQNLIARPTLSRDHRAQALLELGKDYLRAGLLDRAENLFQELVESKLYEEQALRNLLTIYEREKEWNHCLTAVGRLESLTGELLFRQRAHYYCELAEEALAAKDLGLASSYLKKAQNSDRNCVRASLLLGEIEKERGTYRTAIRIFQRAGEQDPVYLSEMLPSLIECHRTLGSLKELRSYLEQLLFQHHGFLEALALTDLIREEEGEAAAAAFLTDYLQERPSLEGMDRLLSMPHAGGREQGAEMFRILHRLLERLLEKQPTYQCINCGFSAKAMHWQCPSCHTWSSVKPSQALPAANKHAGGATG